MLNFIKISTLRWPKTPSLIIFVLVISAAMAVVRTLRFAGYISIESQVVAAFVLFALNIGTALVGFFTRQRTAWLLYLALTIACMLLLGSSPVSSAWILIKMYAPFPR
jgi:hypothetical protein